jgi:hypothetical protein
VCILCNYHKNNLKSIKVGFREHGDGQKPATAGRFNEVQRSGVVGVIGGTTSHLYTVIGQMAVRN